MSWIDLVSAVSAGDVAPDVTLAMVFSGFHAVSGVEDAADVGDTIGWGMWYDPAALASLGVDEGGGGPVAAKVVVGVAVGVSEEGVAASEYGYSVGSRPASVWVWCIEGGMGCCADTTPCVCTDSGSNAVRERAE